MRRTRHQQQSTALLIYGNIMFGIMGLTIGAIIITITMPDHPLVEAMRAFVNR